ncbi:MAG: efflux RND transporter periplasmic adaptor subunit [Pseudomonadota bacterium]
MRYIIRVLSEVFWLLVAVAVVAGGWYGFQTLGANREVVEAQPVSVSVPLVQTESVRLLDGPIPISGAGFLRAERSLGIASEAGGRIVELHPAIEDRGYFNEGDVLFRLDDRQARASIAQIEANIESAEVQRGLLVTQVERGRTLRERGIIPQDQLDQLETSLLEIEASLRSQRANLDAQIIALENTVVKAPFNGRVLEKQTDLGAVIAQGTPVANIYSAVDMEVEVSLRNDEASLIPGLFTSPQSVAYITTEFAGRTYEWAARISHVDRQIDEQTRTIDVVLRLTDPEMGSAVDGDAPPIPALINAYVQTRIEVAGGDPTYMAASQAIRAGDTVWLATEGKLSSIPVEVKYRDSGTVYFTTAGLSPGNQIITSQLPAATDGMAVAVAEQSAMAKSNESN